MSAEQIALEGGPGAELPQFVIALRGYDRGQVDDFIRRQHTILVETELRLCRAEAELAAQVKRAHSLERDLARRPEPTPRFG